MTIGKLAQQAGVNVETVRYYQRRGLIPLPPRRDRGFRSYDDDTLHTLRFVRRLKGLGFTLTEIARVLRLRRQGGDPGPVLEEILTAKQAELERKLRELEATLRGVMAVRAAIRLARGPDRWRALEPD